MLPARRKYLLTFQGERMKTQNINKRITTGFYSNAGMAYDKSRSLIVGAQETDNNPNSAELDTFIIQHLKDLQGSSIADSFLFEFECIPPSGDDDDTSIDDDNGYDWNLCGTDGSRKAMLKESTFVLILVLGDSSRLSSTLLQVISPNIY